MAPAVTADDAEIERHFEIVQSRTTPEQVGTSLERLLESLFRRGLHRLRPSNKGEPHPNSAGFCHQTAPSLASLACHPLPQRLRCQQRVNQQQIETGYSVSRYVVSFLSCEMPVCPKETAMGDGVGPGSGTSKHIAFAPGSGAYHTPYDGETNTFPQHSVVASTQHL